MIDELKKKLMETSEEKMAIKTRAKEFVEKAKRAWDGSVAIRCPIFISDKRVLHSHQLSFMEQRRTVSSRLARAEGEIRGKLRIPQGKSLVTDLLL